MRTSSFDATSPEARTVTSPARLGDRVGALVVAVVAFATYYQAPLPPSGVNIDSSWMLALARGFSEGWQWGSDIVFTYGPLAFLTPYFNWNPDTAASFRIGQIVLCLSWASVAFSFARGLGWVRQFSLLVLLMAWYPVLLMDIGWNAAFAVGIALIARRVDSAQVGQPRRVALAVLLLLASVLALVKFTWLVMWVVMIGYGFVLALLQRDRRMLVLFGLLSPLLLLGLWLGAGQGLPALVDYVATSIEISRGYAAMALPAPPYVDPTGVGVLLLTIAIVVLGSSQLTRRPEGMATLLALCALTFLVWKAGFVMGDAHVVIFFGSATFITLAAVSTVDRQKGRSWLVSAPAIVAVAVVSLVVAYRWFHFDWSITTRTRESLAELLDPAPHRVAMAGLWRQRQQEVGLPTIKALVGDERVDVMMNDAATAILNELSYRPRPIFQGYASYTSALTRRNEARLLDHDAAPAYLLFKLQSFNYRLPMAEDPLAAVAALRAYLPVAQERGYLLMQRTGWPIDPVQPPSSDAWLGASLGDTLSLPDTPMPQMLFLDIGMSAPGSIRGFLLREPELRVEMTLADGTVQSLGFVRRSAATGFLLTPFMLTEADYLRWHASLEERRVVSIRVVAKNASEAGLFDAAFRYALTPVALPRRALADLPPALRSALYPGFDPPPERVVSSLQSIVNEAGRDALFMHAPASIEYQLDAGDWRLEGEFGLLSSAYQCQTSDGIAFKVVQVRDTGVTTQLYERAIDPVHNPLTRGAQRFSLGPFSALSGDRLLLKVETGPSGSSNGDCDWSFVGPVRIGRVGEHGDGS